MIQIVQTGTMMGYQDYHNDFLLNGKRIGSCHYDKKQRLFIGSVEWNGKRSKFFYGKTPFGVVKKAEKFIQAQLITLANEK